MKIQKKNDSDIYIQTISKKELKLKDYEESLGRKIQLFKYKKLDDIKNKNLVNNIVNGLVLNGYLEIWKK